MPERVNYFTRDKDILCFIKMPKKEESSKKSGLQKPYQVSEKLRDFLGLGKDEMISRPEVTRLITEYIKEKSLQHPDNGRVIVPDDKLEGVLNAKGSNISEVTWFNMQTLLNPHFIP